MKKSLSIVLVLSILTCLLAGCEETGNQDEIEKNNEITQNESYAETTNTNDDPADVDFSQADGDMFTDRDIKTDYVSDDFQHITFCIRMLFSYHSSMEQTKNSIDRAFFFDRIFRSCFVE